ncbi:hypothetical protein [Sphaerisporangium rubeum]|uniref:Cellulase/cellobiase CelA1 n=1 Tax=Sphaerisporangium rubeum TaxID=321317 RepID=A0A7X0ILG3_9ACTN|nr:hypothetical protein [Sphaerisporangium rubeum]MBB6475902.1 cellulase/cellobiase CelA1 [Sphaerisporangium rubeum]
MLGTDGGTGARPPRADSRWPDGRAEDPWAGSGVPGPDVDDGTRVGSPGIDGGRGDRGIGSGASAGDPGSDAGATGEEGLEIRLGGPPAEPYGSGDGEPARGGGSRRSRRRPKERNSRRLLVLCVVAVVVAVSVVVIGLRLASGPLTLTKAPDCGPDEVCAAVASGKPNNGLTLPGTADADPLTTDTPADTPTATPTKKAKTAGTRPTPRVTTSAPSPRPSRTTDRPRSSDRPTPERTIAEPDPDPTTDIPEPSPDEPEITPPVSDPENQPLTTTGQVSVGFTVSDVTRAGYTARVTVTNTGDPLTTWQLRLPVGGTVTGADTGDWFQEGATLVLDSSTPLRADETLVVTFTAEGTPTEPTSCRLSTGACQLTAT